MDEWYMDSFFTLEISLTVILSILALGFSAYSVITSKKRNDHADLKELTKILTEHTVVLKRIDGAVFGDPTLSERVVRHDQKFADHERRLILLEKSGKCQ